MSQELLSPDFIKHLENLQIQSKKVIRGILKGERRSPKKGQSVEFADYRNYSAGDDLRFLDWNVFARVEKLFLKLFLEEEDLSISIIIDASASMQAGDAEKFMYAKRVAASLAYIGLRAQDRVSVFMATDKISNALTNMRSKKSVHRIFEFLSQKQTAGQTNLYAALHEYSLRFRNKGVIFLLSDFMDRKGFDEFLKPLSQLQSDIALIHVLSEEEVNPDLTEDLKLVDIETNAAVEISKSEKVLQMYKKTLELFIEHLKNYCTKKGITYTYALTSQSFEELVLRTMRKHGLLK